jgi:dTMP kinase
MTPETELLLMNASRAQLVREVIRPALSSGGIILCDRFYDSTLAYQGYGRGLDLGLVQQIVSCAVGDTRPALTLLLAVPVELSEARRRGRMLPGLENVRDRMEEADRSFFERVEEGYQKLAASEPDRIKTIDATVTVEQVSQAVWRAVEPLLSRALGLRRNLTVDKTAASANVTGSEKKLSF